MDGKGTAPLGALARLYGVQTSYYDVTHRRIRVSPEAVLAVLKALGTPLERQADARDALRERVAAIWGERCEPVAVDWEGSGGTLRVRLPDGEESAPVTGRIRLENGPEREFVFRPSDCPVEESTSVGGRRFAARRVPLPGGLPRGYHRLSLDFGGGTAKDVLLIAAPEKAFVPPDDRAWGLFVPLYALRSGRSQGGGDFSDMESFMEWTASLGGAVVGTLPILASFLGTPFNPSPYSPASRLFWNELYLDLARIPELEICPPARELLASEAFREEALSLSNAAFADYAGTMALKRRVLEPLSRAFFAAEGSPRLHALREFAAAHPAFDDYAAFRAAGERAGASWRVWPEPQKNGALSPADYDEEVRRYHLYVQWVARAQIASLAEKARGRGCRLLLDLPLGVDSDSYDVWRLRESFASGASGGAPPDPFSTKGQDWGFPPLHPERIRRNGYRYFIESVRHHLELAGILRFDHVMALHRLYWVPHGLPATEGSYVRYRADELYAILCLESLRHGSVIVGEDLGTVPPCVRPEMSRRGLFRMFIAQEPPVVGRGRSIRPASRELLAGLNTHDMPTFAAFWEGKDVQDRLSAGLVDGVRAQEDRENREGLKRSYLEIMRRGGLIEEDPPDTTAALRAFLAYLAASPARVLLINLEDLWIEKEPQNVPSVTGLWPNWRRRARYALEEYSGMPEVLETLAEVDRRRRRLPGRQGLPRRGRRGRAA
jgi:4-alpha-glucanotransferase